MGWEKIAERRGAGLLAVFALIFTASLTAHMMSTSSGDLVVEGSTGKLTVRMPIYEAADIETPGEAVLNAFSIEGAEMAIVGCEDDRGAGMSVCTAELAFPAEPDEVTVECNLPSITVPNHVHILRISKGDTAEQKVFDFNFRRQTVRFRPLGPVELMMSEGGAGFWRAALGPAQVLFVLALALAGRNRRELLLLAGAFIAAEIPATFGLLAAEWAPPQRFAETAGALTVAYLAVELLALPEAGARWAVAAGMGVFHGLYFADFLKISEMNPARVLAGAALAEALLFTIFALLFARLKKDFGDRLFTKILAVPLLLVGLVWFAIRVFG